MAMQSGRSSIPPRNAFVVSERLRQAAFFKRQGFRDILHEAAAYRLQAGCYLSNLATQIREPASRYFAPGRKVSWHRFISHGLSSQASCLNHLMPLATQPALLGRVLGAALEDETVTVLPIDIRQEQAGGAAWHETAPWFIGFEWIGGANHLEEWPLNGLPTRGANVTSADAVANIERGGIHETVLIEWKYTESYGAPVAPGGNDTRRARYGDKIFWPDGPIKPDIGISFDDFLWEPLYQLLRQQILAWQMERAEENGAKRVTVLHIAPAGNLALRKVTSPLLRTEGNDVFSVFRSLLVEPDRFVSRTTEQVFDPFFGFAYNDPAARDWAAYLLDRYATSP